jgi:hypothetical protein
MSETTVRGNPEVAEPWFTNLESRWLKAAEAEQLELETVQSMLVSRGLVYVGRSKRPDRIETTYWLRDGEGRLIQINGRNRPMTKDELGEHLGQQTEEAITQRNQQNWKFAAHQEKPNSPESLAPSTDVPGGALVRIAEEMSRNADRLMRQGATETDGGTLVSIAEFWARKAPANRAR